MKHVIIYQPAEGPPEPFKTLRAFCAAKKVKENTYYRKAFPFDFNGGKVYKEKVN